MKKISLALFILSLFGQETIASSSRSSAVPNREICLEIQESFSRGLGAQSCDDLFTKFPGLPGFARDICASAVNKFSEDPDNAFHHCKEEFEDFRMEAGPMALMPTFAQVVELPQPQLRQSIAAQQCDEKSSDDYICTIETDFVLPDINSIMRSLSSLPLSVPAPRLAYSDAKCQCVKESVRKSNQALQDSSFDSSLEKEKRRITSLILNAAGKKLINDFASNLEDFNFFETNNVRVLGGNSRSGQIACNNFADFRNTIMERCRLGGIQASEAEERLSSLMNSFGDLGKRSSAEQVFNNLKNDIMTYQLDPSSVFPGRSGTFSRQDYDRFRYGVYKSRPEVKFINDITELLLDDKKIGPQILRSIQNGMNPSKILYAYLSDEHHPEIKRILRSYIRKNRNSDFHRNLKGVLETENEGDYKAFLVDTFDMATDMHPGLKALFKNSELFLSVRNDMHARNQHSLLEALDGSDGSLVDYFQERCEKIKNDFAEATCTPRDNLINRTNREDLAHLLSSMDTQLNPALTDVLLCEIPSTTPDSLFTRLAFKPNDRLNQADYFLMKVNPENKTASRFGQIAHTFAGGDEVTFKALNDIAAFGDNFRVPAASVAMSEKASTGSAPVQEAVTGPVTPEMFRNTEIIQNRLPQEGAMNNYLAPLAPQAAPSPAVVNNQSSSREMLRNFLADKGNEEEVDRLLRNTTSEDHEELMRLRSEVESSQSRIMELMREIERQKLDDLRANYERLEREVNNPTPARSSQVEDNEESLPSASSTAYAPTQVQNVARPQDAGGAVSGGTTSTSSAGGSGAGAPVNRTIASEEAITPSVNLDSQAAIVIESSAVQSSSNVAREDINREVIEYLEKIKPDFNTLRKLKESGIILKYKVLENGKEVLREMRVNYSSLSPEAKQLLERRLEREQKVQELAAARRSYSYSALRQLLGIRAQERME